MQAKKAAQLREAWGTEKPCPHESLAKEYDQCVRTGNYVCKSCGKLFTFSERAEWKAKRPASPDAKADDEKPHVAHPQSQGDGQP